jgi:hypothetical protein
MRIILIIVVFFCSANFLLGFNNVSNSGVFSEPSINNDSIDSVVDSVIHSILLKQNGQKWLNANNYTVTILCFFDSLKIGHISGIKSSDLNEKQFADLFEALKSNSVVIKCVQTIVDNNELIQYSYIGPRYFTLITRKR